MHDKRFWPHVSLCQSRGHAQKFGSIFSQLTEVSMWLKCLVYHAPCLLSFLDVSRISFICTFFFIDKGFCESEKSHLSCVILSRCIILARIILILFLLLCTITLDHKVLSISQTFIIM